MDAKPMRNHGWPTISLIKYGIISCWFYLKKHNTQSVDVILQVILHIFLIWISTTSKPFRILNYIQFNGI
jgi:hypothetical protein